jgi:hypothetical protein
MMKAGDLFPGPEPDKKVKEIKAWLAEKGVKDLEPVPLSTETFEKVRSTWFALMLSRFNIL